LGARTNARTLSASLVPFVSTPLRTSTAYGRVVRTQSATFSGVRPPLTTKRRSPRAADA